MQDYTHGYRCGIACHGTTDGPANPVKDLDWARSNGFHGYADALQGFIDARSCLDWDWSDEDASEGRAR